MSMSTCDMDMPVWKLDEDRKWEIVLKTALLWSNGTSGWAVTVSHVLLSLPGGNMVQFVTKRRETKSLRGGLCIDEDEARFYFLQLLSAVEYCHRHHVAHRWGSESAGGKNQGLWVHPQRFNMQYAIPSSLLCMHA